MSTIEMKTRERKKEGGREGEGRRAKASKGVLEKPVSSLVTLNRR
jgi:hypothetical protein